MKTIEYIILVIALAMSTAPAFAAPTIDGVINSEEWPDKISITFNGYEQPSNLKYGDLYVMNDANNIYVAVVIPDTKEDSDYLMLDFDIGHDHMATNGKEDAAGFNVANLYGGTTGYLDYYWDGYWWGQDLINHGAGAMTFSNGKYSYEFSKPLSSGDMRDMTLHPGDTVGFRIETWDGTLNDWYRYPKNTVDADTSGWAYWDSLTVVAVNLVDSYLPPGATPEEMKAGLIKAMDDYFDNGVLTKSELLSVMDAYFA